MKDLLKFLVKLCLFSVLLFAARYTILEISQFLLMGSCSILGMRVTSEMLPYDSSDKLLLFLESHECLPLYLSEKNCQQIFPHCLYGCC